MTLRVLYLSGAERFPEALAGSFDGDPRNQLIRCEAPAEVESALERGIVELLLIDADRDFEASSALCTRLKADPFNSVVPIVFFSREHRMEEIATAFERGADEFLSGTQTTREQALRLRMVLERAARDVAVNPTTMLPGTKIIQLDIQRRIAGGETFAVCYADIDCFKEFNDKHSYHRGDRVIWIVSAILRDVVRRLSRNGFVGHVGGDDFIFTLPVKDLESVSRAIIDTFDTLMPLQYPPQDRERGHYLAEDRQGNLRETPLMSISLGCVTNVHRQFTHPARVSELANEMKSYAKSFPGSVFVVDRRRDVRPESAATGIEGRRERGSR
ncbi:GGDEF domain-containing protein [soil metagenome]